jgi:hypothetical protein
MPCLCNAHFAPMNLEYVPDVCITCSIHPSMRVSSKKAWSTDRAGTATQHHHSLHADIKRTKAIILHFN